MNHRIVLTLLAAGILTVPATTATHVLGAETPEEALAAALDDGFAIARQALVAALENASAALALPGDDGGDDGGLERPDLGDTQAFCDGLRDPDLLIFEGGPVDQIVDGQAAGVAALCEGLAPTTDDLFVFLERITGSAFNTTLAVHALVRSFEQTMADLSLQVYDATEDATRAAALAVSTAVFQAVEAGLAAAEDTVESTGDFADGVYAQAALLTNNLYGTIVCFIAPGAPACPGGQVL